MFYRARAHYSGKVETDMCPFARDRNLSLFLPPGTSQELEVVNTDDIGRSDVGLIGFVCFSFRRVDLLGMV